MQEKLEKGSLLRGIDNKTDKIFFTMGNFFGNPFYSFELK